MTGAQHPTTPEETQPVELYPPVDDDGWHASQVRDWVAVCPELSEAAVRLYLILRALVIEKRGPVRKLTLWELCHLMPSKGAKKGVVASSVSRIRNLLRELTEIGLVTTPEGLKLTTSSRALAAGRGLRMRINLMPVKTYTGPRNVFDLLDDIRDVAADSARKARKRELELAAQKRAKRAAEGAGQNSDPGVAGQNFDPLGQNFDPLGQNSDPHSGADLQDREPPLSPPAQTSRSATDGVSVRPSVQVEDAYAQGTDGRTADGAQGGEDGTPGAAGPDAAQAGAAPNSSSRGAVPGGAGVPSAGETTPGMEVLVRVGRVNEALRLAGVVLRDQAKRITEVIAGSEALGEPWKLNDLVTILSAPLDGPIRKSAGAVVSARITALPPTPRTSMVPPQDRGGVCWPEKSAQWSAGEERTVEEAVRVPAGQRKNCAGREGLCDRLALPGEDLCARCRDGREPVCPEYGCTNRVLVPGALCAGCQSGDGAEAGPPLTACPGYDGTPCGRMPQAGGMCLRCRTAAEQARAALDEDWAAQVAAVTGMSDDERAAVEAGAGPPPF
ncbi:hypothetical protein ACFXAQ_32940 [Streptomyces olivaceus]|uniref:hypothetical protein n=1 Tax=Streptomyces olivaceus TaxID=47716 RepID=UPI003681C2B5